MSEVTAVEVGGKAKGKVKPTVILLTPERREKTTFEKVMLGYSGVQEYLIKLEKPKYPFPEFLGDLVESGATKGKTVSENAALAFSIGGVSEAEKAFVWYTCGSFADRLKKISLFFQEGNPTEKQKVALAQFNQKMATGLFYALKGDWDKADQADSFVELVGAFAAGETGFRGREQVKIMLSGARAQAGLMYLLETNGYQIFPLDSENAAQVRQLDLGGVDFIARRPDGLKFLIDAKARKWNVDNTGEITEERLTVSISEKYHPKDELRRMSEHYPEAITADDIELGRCIGMTVILPSSPRHLGEYGNIMDDTIKKDILEKIKILR